MLSTGVLMSRCSSVMTLTLPTHAHASELGYMLANLSRFNCCKVNTNSV